MLKLVSRHNNGTVFALYLQSKKGETFFNYYTILTFKFFTMLPHSFKQLFTTIKFDSTHPLNHLASFKSLYLRHSTFKPIRLIFSHIILPIHLFFITAKEYIQYKLS